MKKLLVAALFAMAVGPAAEASPLPCQPYPYCCPFEANPRQCLGGDVDASLPVGGKCAFNSSTDVTREPGWQTGDMRAGPLVTAENGTLHCKIIVNGNTHDSTRVRADIGFPATGGVVVAGATTLNYQATAADDITLCTSWVPDAGVPKYWAYTDSTSKFGHWSTDPSSTCGFPLTIEPGSPECSIWKAVDRRLGTNLAEIWQDCEPYEEFPLPI